MHVNMLPNLTVYTRNPETFRILGAGILLPPSFTIVISENDVILPVHCRSFRDHSKTTSQGKISPSFTHCYLYCPPHVIWPNASLAFLFHPGFISLISLQHFEHYGHISAIHQLLNRLSPSSPHPWCYFCHSHFVYFTLVFSHTFSTPAHLTNFLSHLYHPFLFHHTPWPTTQHY